MEIDKVAFIGIRIDNSFLSHIPGKNSTDFLSDKTIIPLRMLFTLANYLTKHSKKFDGVRCVITDKVSELYPNGTLNGIAGMANRSEIDIGINPLFEIL